jgi:hypothetical protein
MAVRKSAVKKSKTPVVKKAGKTVLKKPAKKPTKKAAKKAAPKPKPPVQAKTPKELDFSAFPAESLLHEQRGLCLACILDVFTRQLGMAARTAQTEIRRYAHTVAELTATPPGRPYLAGSHGAKDPCPWCGAPAKWRARLLIHRVESGPSTDAARRALVKTLPDDGSFEIVEEKATRAQAFYEWLEHTSALLDFDQPAWLLEATHHYLARVDPKTDWPTVFAGLLMVRRSRRIDEGWEREGDRLFLAPRLFDEVLLVQYLLSRGHRAGGLTFEGRLTLQELIARLRGAGYLRAAGVDTRDAGDAFEQLIGLLGGGDSGMKFYYLVDRRDLLAKLKELKETRVPKAKPVSA